MRTLYSMHLIMNVQIDASGKSDALNNNAHTGDVAAMENNFPRSSWCRNTPKTVQCHCLINNPNIILHIPSYRTSSIRNIHSYVTTSTLAAPEKTKNTHTHACVTPYQTSCCSNGSATLCSRPIALFVAVDKQVHDSCVLRYKKPWCLSVI